jgi:hypothetical protein
MSSRGAAPPTIVHRPDRVLHRFRDLRPRCIVHRRRIFRQHFTGANDVIRRPIIRLAALLIAGISAAPLSLSAQRTTQPPPTASPYAADMSLAAAERDMKEVAGAASLRAHTGEYGPHLRDPSLSPEERRGWADVVGVLDLRIADEKGTYLVLPTVTVTHRYVLDDCTAPVEALFIGPAHTDGDIAVWTPKQRVVATGDMVVAPIPYGGSSPVEWPATLMMRDSSTA